MDSRTALIGALALAVSACATAPQTTPQTAAFGQWQSVAKTDLQEAFIDPSTIAIVDGYLEAGAKLNFAQAQPSAKKDRSYLSARNTYRFDCAQRRVAMKEIRAYEGPDLQGAQVQKATSSAKNLQWLDAPDSTVFGELLDYACKNAPPG
jgi:hypothetical protein